MKTYRLKCLAERWLHARAEGRTVGLFFMGMPGEAVALSELTKAGRRGLRVKSSTRSAHGVIRCSI